MMQSICNEGEILPVMRELVERERMSTNAAAKSVHEDSGRMVPAARADQVYREKHPVTPVAASNLLKK